MLRLALSTGRRASARGRETLLPAKGGARRDADEAPQPKRQPPGNPSQANEPTRTIQRVLTPVTAHGQHPADDVAGSNRAIRRAKIVPVQVEHRPPVIRRLHRHHAVSRRTPAEAAQQNIAHGERIPGRGGDGHDLAVPNRRVHARAGRAKSNVAAALKELSRQPDEEVRVRAGCNDGIVSTGALLVGVAGSGADRARS